MSERFTTDELIELLRGRLVEMDDDTRMKTLDKVSDGYCHWCGSDLGTDCQCMNDE